MKRILDQEDDPYMQFLCDNTPISNSFMQELYREKEQSHMQSDVKIEQQLINGQLNGLNGNGYDGYREKHVEDEQSQMNQQGQGQGKKERKKVFYRDKMAQLLSEENYVKQEYNYNDSHNYEKGKSPISRDEQLRRNRESAKNSRQRKKEYVTTLQLKNEEYQRMIEGLNEKLRLVMMQRDRLKQFNHTQVYLIQTQIKNFMASKSQAYQNLSRALNNPGTSDSSVQQQVSKMLQRFGAAGSQRVSAINYYINEIIEILLSDIHKYFINCSALNQGCLNKDNLRLDQEIINVLEIDNIRVMEIMNKYKDRFNRQACVFKNLTQEFYRMYKSIETQALIIEKVFNELCQEFDCRHIGKLILWFQENKYRRDVRKVRTDWIQQLMHGEEVEGTLRKQAKLESK